MAKMAQEILTIDVAKVLEMLNKAYADEWLAYSQYWLGAKLAVGPMRDAVVKELEEHAIEELNHAVMLTNRIIQLGGTPPINPQEWYKVANCQYADPKDPYVATLLKQNIEGEQCAIQVYNKILKETKETDFVTYNIALQILEDEIEHEEDLTTLLEDIQTIKYR